MKTTCMLMCVGLATTAATAGVKVGVGPSTEPWLGFMNVFNLPGDGGDYQFGSGWGISDLVTTFDDADNSVSMSPNTIGDPDPYWYIGGGGPGAAGNKIMEANTYQESTDGGLHGITLEFSGVIESNTLTGAHEAQIFIRDFAPDYSSSVDTFAPATPGPFSISLATDADTTRHIQWGIQVKGVNVWATDVAPFGEVTFATPAPSALGVLGVSMLGMRRRRA